MKVPLLVAVLGILLHTSECKVNGGWSGWSGWSGCAPGVCAGNQRIRTRTCSNPLPKDNGAYCAGDNAEQKDCMIDGGFSEWSQWSQCENPCGGSYVNRSRTCTNPKPTPDGKPCSGDTVQDKLECIWPCPTGPVDGQWGEWSSFTSCPRTCGIPSGTVITRTRQCNRPPSMNGGKPCAGNATEAIRSCFSPCPVKGGFTRWSSWSRCSKTCGTGNQRRTRTCTSPRPIHGGQNCTGDLSQMSSCRLAVCPGAIDGGFTSWNSWSRCTESKYCLKGTSSRARTCTNPSPVNGGDECSGIVLQKKDCPTPEDGCSVYLPNRPDKAPTDANSFIKLECETDEKFTTKGVYASKVPSEIYSLFSFIRSELQNGWFGIKMETDAVDIKKQYTKVCFEIIDPLHIIKIVNNIAKYYNRTKALPKWDKPGMYDYVPGISMTMDTSASYWLKLKKYEFQVGSSESYVPYKTIKMTNNRLTYYTEGNTQTFKAKGDYNVGTAIFKTEIKKDVMSSADYATGTAASLKFHELMTFFGVSSNIVPDMIKNGLKKAGIWDFTMSPASFAYKLADAGTFRFTSSISAGGVPVHVEVLTALRFNRIAFAVGFAFDRESFGALAEKLSDINVDFLNSLGIEFEIGVAFSPPKTQQVYIDSETGFSKEPLKSQIVLAVPQGLFIGAQFVLPKDCKNNKFCEITKNIIGPTATAYINGLIEWKKVTVKAGLKNIYLGNGFYFHKLELYVIADWNSTAKTIKLGFVAEVKIPVNGKIYRDGLVAPSNDLILGGGMEYNVQAQEVSGKLYFRGMWRRAFWINWLSLGNIYLGVTYTIGAPVPITGIQFGMRAEFGYDCLIPADFEVDGHCFGGAGYVGVGKPNFFYADMTALTIGKICRMISSKIKLPGPIDETGFPQGAQVAYSTDDVDLRIAGGPYVYKGFMLKGKVNIFGWSIFVDIFVGDTRIKLDLQPDPIKIASIAKFVRSPTDDKKGPWFFIDARSDPLYWKAYIEGYIDIFSISIYTRLNFTMSHLELLVQGNFLNLIKAEVFVAAEYGLSFSFNGAKFYVRVKVDLSGINNLLDAAADAVKGAFEAAQKKLGDARRHVIEKKAECKRKMSLKCDRCRNMKCKQAEKNCKGALDAAGKWIGGAINAAGQWIAGAAKKVGKAFQAVGNFVKKIFKGWRRKRDLQNQQHELFVLHVRKRRFLSKLLCEGIVGGGCSVVSHLCEGTCKAFEFIGKGLCNILDIAIGFLKGIEAVCGWVSKAIQFVLTQLFRIHSIKFEFAMDTYIGGFFKSMTFNAAVDLTIFGKRLYLALGFSLTNPLASLKSGGNKATNWYKDKMNPKGRTDTEKEYYDKPNPFADFEMSEQFSIENQQAATDDRKGGCLFAESKSKNTFIKMTGCNETDERQYFAYTYKGQLMNTWSKLCVDTNGASAGSKLIQTTCNPSRDDQNFQCDLVVRTVKRRRVNMCWQAGDVSLNGPGSLVHLGSLKCIHVSGGGNGVPNDGTKLVIYAGCNEKRLEFALENNYLIHKGSGKCVAPIGKVFDGARLGLYRSCSGHKFSFTKGGSLQHIPSRKCINVRSLSAKPGNGEDIVLNSLCENSDKSVEKERMLFNFIPTDPYIKLAKCVDFGKPLLNQRFEVENEAVATVCSKFAKNVAFKKKTYQSSTAYNGYSARAVDENFNSVYDQKSCTHTNSENNPWWKVDLGSENIITDVLIVNRYNNYDRLKNFEVKVGIHSDPSKNPTCNDRIGVVGQGQGLRVQCVPPIPGRYVAIQMFGKGILTLCEVAVYSRLAPLADLCQLDNGNCEQTCYNLCNLKTKCGCYPGFKLAYDGKTCIDTNECETNNGGCDNFKSRCINYPGGYTCACKAGYQMVENKQNQCEDRNECKKTNAGCEHICENTVGSFRCNCLKGYKLNDDEYGCTDVDECLVKKGGCAHTCKNYHGGYYCKCNTGYRLKADDHGCEEIYCPPLEDPFKGAIAPTTCTDERENIRRNTMCSYKCATGYKLTNGDGSLTCNIDGTWTGRVPYCAPVMCPKLSALPNGGLVPRSCSMKNVEHGIRCVYHCNPGYELRGPRYVTCNNTKWTEFATVSCVRVYKKPWIQCPQDVIVKLSANSKTAVLGNLWSLPASNMKTTAVSPSNLDENYAFPAGKTRVKWTATNGDGTAKSCFYYVIVEDKTPPQASNCPTQPIIIKSNSAIVTVSWKEPTFTDNVGVVMTMSSKSPGDKMERDTSLNVRYTAIDAAGNTAHCDFQVSAKGYQCPRMINPPNGNINQNPYMLFLSCLPNYYFNPKPEGANSFSNAVYRCMSGEWKIYVFGTFKVLTKVPACSGFTSPVDGKCKLGSTLNNGICMNCGQGTFHEAINDNKCIECPIGTYQDVDGMTACQPCNKGYSTKAARSTKASECLPQCSPGKYSDNGLEESFAPCKKCPMGTYQANEGQTSCTTCPYGSATQTTGSTSIDACTVPAKITETYPLSELKVDVDNVLILECFVEGRPSPTVTWKKIGGTQPSPDRLVSSLLYDMSMTVIGRDYVISSAKLSDSGTYECHVQNSLASGSHRINVIVQTPQPGITPN